MKPKDETAEKRGDVGKNSFHRITHKNAAFYSPNLINLILSFFKSDVETWKTDHVQLTSLFCSHNCNAKFLSCQVNMATKRRQLIRNKKNKQDVY